ncbi:MAG: ECF transporter S component [Fusobacteriaceae bacterium]|jgi:energy-coupling factor transport system substrate-specific component|nr:ECF transporter S component [Fusobacteriaceae bacterium]
MIKFNWKLKDIIMVCIFSVVFSFIYLGAVHLANILATVLAPFGFAPFSYEILFGIWFMAATFVGYIIQKPGVAIVAEVLAAVIEVIMGNMFGPMVILSGIIQGLGAELIFAKNKYKNFNMPNMCIAALGSSVASFIFGFLRGNLSKYTTIFLIAMFIVRGISSIVFAGIISKITADKLANTGALKGYSLGKNNDI